MIACNVARSVISHCICNSSFSSKQGSFHTYASCIPYLLSHKGYTDQILVYLSLVHPQVMQQSDEFVYTQTECVSDFASMTHDFRCSENFLHHIL